jgi:ubiquitin C-terminal hydrolase
MHLGNTSYMNAAIQCVFNVAKLTDYIITDSDGKENSNNLLGSRGCVLRAYRHLARMMATSRTAVAAHELKDAIGAHNAMFADSRQHDSFEFLVALLDVIHEDLNSAPRLYQDREKVHAAKESHGLVNQLIIVDLFHGWSRTTIAYDDYALCADKEELWEPLVYWALPLPRSSRRLNLDQCIKA